MRAAPPQKAAGYGSISLVQLKGKDSDWMGMTNKYGEAWEVPVTPQLPWDIRIVGTDGQEVGACSGFQGAGIRVLGLGLPTACQTVSHSGACMRSSCAAEGCCNSAGRFPAIGPGTPTPVLVLGGLPSAVPAC